MGITEEPEQVLKPDGAYKPQVLGGLLVAPPSNSQLPHPQTPTHLPVVSC